MSISKFMVANVAVPSVGAATAAFGKALGLDLMQFAVLAALMASSLAAGAYALYSETTARDGVSPDDARRMRRRIAGSFVAKFMLGLVVVYQIDAKPWMVVLIGLGLGGGTVIWTMLSDLRKGLADQPPGDDDGKG